METHKRYKSGLLKTNSKEFTAIIENYILSCIDGEGYGVEFTEQLSTDKEKLDFLAKCFKFEYLNEHNRKYYGNNVTVILEQWYTGLPSVFNIDFYYNDILRLAREWKSLPEHTTEAQENRITSHWFALVAQKTMNLFKKHNIIIE